MFTTSVLPVVVRQHLPAHRNIRCSAPLRFTPVGAKLQVRIHLHRVRDVRRRSTPLHLHRPGDRRVEAQVAIVFGAVISMIVRSGILFTVTVRYACAGCTGVIVQRPVTGGARAHTLRRRCSPSVAAATVVGEVAGACAGTSPSQFAIRSSPAALPPPAGTRSAP